jgi:hypothetical protein
MIYDFVYGHSTKLWQFFNNCLSAAIVQGEAEIPGRAWYGFLLGQDRLI